MDDPGKLFCFSEPQFLSLQNGDHCSNPCGAREDPPWKGRDFPCVSISGWKLNGMMKGRHLAQFLAHGWHFLLAESLVQGQVSGQEERSEE